MESSKNCDNKEFLPSKFIETAPSDKKLIFYDNFWAWIMLAFLMVIIYFWGAKKRLIIKSFRNYPIAFESLAYIYAYYIIYRRPLIISDEP